MGIRQRKRKEGGRGMKVVDTTKETRYSPLIPAIKAICQANPGDKIQIIMTNQDAFKDLKEYLSIEDIGFREIYDADQMILQFNI